MTRKYFWHFVFFVFTLIILLNIFQKLKWSGYTDDIIWQTTPGGLTCSFSKQTSPVKNGDLLLTVNKYIITNKTDLARAIENRKFCRYEIERNGLLRTLGVDIIDQSTPFSYYILVFCGLMGIILNLRLININVITEKRLPTPIFFYFLNLSLAGFLIFSPTGNYHFLDFVFLFLDRFCFIFFPAFLLHFSLFYPIKLRIVRKITTPLMNLILYIIPTTFLSLNLFFIIKNIIHPQGNSLLISINYFHHVADQYFTFYTLMALGIYIYSSTYLIARKKLKKFIFPLTGIIVSIMAVIGSIYFFPVDKEPGVIAFFLLLPITFLPFSLTNYLSQRRFTDIENIIKKTAAISFIFLFIFGIYFFLDINIQKNIALGIFWSIATILTAGLLFKPIEDTIQRNFEKIFFKASYNFKIKLRELIQAIRTERDLTTLAGNFLNTINNGLQLQQSTLMIHFRKNIFYMYPEKNKISLSKSFQNSLFYIENLSFYSLEDFKKNYPKDYIFMKNLEYFQFLPLKSKERLIGLVAFGLKKDHTYLSMEDWELMANIAPSLALSVENAYLYSQLENQFNQIILLKEFNENIILNISLGIVVLNRFNIINTWNKFMELKFLVTAKQAINKKAYIIFGHKLWQKIYEKKQSLSILHNIGVDIKGREVIFDIYISQLKDNHGTVIGTILVFEDVTEKINFQNQIIMAEKMASVGLLSAGIAHEINTPLTGISSYCQIILDNPKEAENIELIHKIQEQVLRANKIIRTLLDFSRKKGEHPQEIDLNKTIEESISLVEHQLKKKNISLIRNFKFNQKIYGFSNQIQQMFINLLINSCDAIENDLGLIKIEGSENEIHITIRIEDNGMGIPPGQVKKIFDPFFTTKEKGKGTGLGLSISYNIVKDHYGDIEVDTSLKNGTAFIITFPVNSPLRRIKI